MSITNRIVFMGALYHAGVRCSYLPGFLEICGPILDQAYDSRLALGRAVSLRVDSLKASSDRTTALARLCARDLRRIQAVINDTGVAIPDNIDEIEEQILSAGRMARDILGEFGISVIHSELHLVEQLPEPFGHNGASALAIDEADKQAYGLRPGIYMLRDSLRPFYSANLYLHELIHTVLGADDPEKVAHGLEEGLADLVGAIWLSAQIMGPELTRNIFVLNRLSSQYNPVWERYLDSARRLCMEYMTSGPTALIDMLRGGRGGLYAREVSLGIQSSLVPQGGQPDEQDDLVHLATDLLIGYPRSFVVSPEAYLFAEQSKSGLSVAEVATAAGLSLQEGNSAAAELRDSMGAIFLRKDNIVILEGEAASTLSMSWLRYETQ